MWTDLKYLMFFATLAIGVPLLTSLLLAKPKFREYALIAMVIIPIIGEPLSINFFAEPFYRGSSRGWEVTLTNLISLAFFLALRLARDLPQKWKWYFPGCGLYWLYFAAGVVSLINAANVLFGCFELWKMLMMYLYLVVIANYLYNTKNFFPIVKTLALVCTVTFIMIMHQRYIVVRYQPSGPFPHQNSMAMYLSVSGCILLSAWLNGNLSKLENNLIALSFIFAATGTVLSFSRGAMVFFPVGCLIVVFLSLATRITSKKLKILGVLFSGGALLFILLLPPILNRFMNAPDSSKDMRVQLALAAFNMADDNILGVGINNWGIKVNPPYPYGAHLTERAPGGEEHKNGLVETIYLMVVAECGYWGLAVLLIMFGYFFILNFLNFNVYKHTFLQYLAPGIAGGLFCDYCQSVLEWVLKQNINFSQLMLIFAMIGAMRAIYNKYHKVQNNRSVF